MDVAFRDNLQRPTFGSHRQNLSATLFRPNTGGHDWSKPFYNRMIRHHLGCQAFGCFKPIG